EFVLNSNCVTLNIGVRRAGNRHLRRRGCTEVQNLADEIPGIKGELRAWKFLGQLLSEFFLDTSQRNGRVRLQANIDDGLLRSAGPQEDCIDWIRGALRSDVAKRKIQIIGTCLLCDRCE